MAKGLNKHTPDSEELLKRLNSNDSSGLDDFEKEALEGFDSLDNAELAKNLTDSLNKKIDEKYFQKESKSKKPLYLSMAAGLVLVVGLSIFFMNIMGDKKEMAMESAPDTEKIANEVSKPNDLAPAPAELEETPKTEGKSSAAGGDVPVTTVDALAKSEEKFVSAKDVPNDNRAKEQPDKDDGLTSRMVLKEKKTETPKEPYKSSDAESGDDLKNIESDKMKGPPSGNNSPTTPMVIADQKAKPVQNVPEEEANEKVTLSENNSDNNNNISRNDSKSGKTANKQAPQKKERRKEKGGEALGNEDVVVTLDESTVSQTTFSQNAAAVGGVASGTKRDENGYLHNVEFSNHAYSKPQDYIKVEISKSEMLKTNVKAFKAELTINEKGTVTAVKFLTPIDTNCAGCKKELEKILLNMPGWKPKTKSAVETVSYIDQ